ncbi:pyridoxal-phosphate dependent enzyme [Roseateles sp. MS654]|uniref:pyridoxal-phosphate dependent enzyme n=1 Tax=Roseateles sp. MS654 TaxID=3412685 RepID=UPI003C2FED1D
MTTAPAAHIVTPIVPSIAFSSADQQVWLKLEGVQPTGSIQLRGIAAACGALAAQGAQRLMIVSDGEDALAAAYAARALELPCLVVHTKTATEKFRRRLRHLDATAVIGGQEWDEAQQTLLTLRRPTDGVIDAMNEALTDPGYATLVTEAANQMPRPDAILACVEPAGLISGLMMGLNQVGWEDVPFIAAEVLGSHALASAIGAGSPTPMPGASALVRTQAPRRVSDRDFAWARKRAVVSEILTELHAIRGALEVAEHHQTVISPGSGAAIAAAMLKRSAMLRGASNVLVIVSGKVNWAYLDLLVAERAIRDNRGLAQAREPDHSLMLSRFLNDALPY